MTIVYWPVELPLPERSSWNAQPQEARKKRQSDAGPPSYRRRFSSAAKMVAMSVLLTADQRAIFDNFFEYETSMGSLLFWMPDPSTDGWGLFASDSAPLLISGGPDDGKPLLLAAQWLCTFGDQLPAETIQGNQFRKAFGVVVIP
jgi:hypothetical protein